MNVESWLNDPGNYWSDDEFYSRAKKKTQKDFTIYHTATQLIILETNVNSSKTKKPAKNKPSKKRNESNEQNYSNSSLNSQTSQKNTKNIRKTKETNVSYKKNDLNHGKYWNTSNFPNYVEIERLARRINRILNMEIIF